MRAALALIVVSVAVAATVHATRDAPAAGTAAKCLLLLRWHHDTYIGHLLRGYRAGAKLAPRARQGPCADPFDGEIVGGAPMAIRRLRGLQPAFAVANGGYVYVNASTFPALPSHPMHARLKRMMGDPPQRTGATCRLTGTADFTWGALTVNGVAVAVWPDTQVDSQRDGTGYVPGGAKIAVDAQPCGEDSVDAVRISLAS